MDSLSLRCNPRLSSHLASAFTCITGLHSPADCPPSTDSSEEPAKVGKVIAKEYVSR